MSKPIIGVYGEYVTKPECYTSFTIEHVQNKGAMVQETQPPLFSPETKTQYATREAAEHALTRAKCIQRLSVMAYGNGWLPKHSLGGLRIVVRDECDMPVSTGVLARTVMEKQDAEETITPAEREAFLYVYQPEEE